MPGNPQQRAALIAELTALGRLPDDERLDVMPNEQAARLLHRYARIMQSLYEHSDRTTIDTILDSSGYGHACGVYRDALEVLLAQDEIPLRQVSVSRLVRGHAGSRRLAAEVLQHVGDRTETRVLTAALDDPKPLVREAVALALRRRADPAARSALEAAQLDPDPAVRAAVNSALEAYVEPPAASLRRATDGLSRRLHDVVSLEIGGIERRLVLLDVATLQEGDRVYDHFVREQEHIMSKYLARHAELRAGPNYPAVKRVLVLDIRHAAQDQAAALADLARVLRAPGTRYAPDARRLWDEVRFLEGFDVAPRLSLPQPIP